MVAQVDEQQSTVVADAVAPAGQPDFLANVGFAERAAGVGTIAMHENPGNQRQRAESGDMGARVRAQGLPERRERGNRMVPPKWLGSAKNLKKNNGPYSPENELTTLVTGNPTP